jgi:hypothetical protein
VHDVELDAAVLLAALGRLVVADRAVLAMALRLEALRRDVALLDQVVDDRAEDIALTI